MKPPVQEERSIGKEAQCTNEPQPSPIYSRHIRVSRRRAPAADRPLAPGVARRRVRGAAARLARRGGVRRRQMGARRGAGRIACAPDSRGCSATRQPTSRSGRTRTSWSRAGCRRCRSVERQRIVTTDGEFHTIRRQMDRFADEGIEVRKVAAHPVDTLAERLASEVDDRTLAVLVSSVLFETPAIVPGLDREWRRRARRMAPNCSSTPITISTSCRSMSHRWDCKARSSRAAATSTASLARATASFACRMGALCGPSSPGGSPSSSRSNPQATNESRSEEALRRSPAPPTIRRRTIARPPSSTFHQQQGLTPDELRPDQPASGRAADLGVRAARCLQRRSRTSSRCHRSGAAGSSRSARRRRASWLARLRERGVFVDARGDVLRIGPAPYLRDDQLTDAVAALGESVRAR